MISRHTTSTLIRHSFHRPLAARAGAIQRVTDTEGYTEGYTDDRRVLGVALSQLDVVSTASMTSLIEKPWHVLPPPFLIVIIPLPFLTFLVVMHGLRKLPWQLPPTLGMIVAVLAGVAVVAGLSYVVQQTPPPLTLPLILYPVLLGVGIGLRGVSVTPRLIPWTRADYLLVGGIVVVGMVIRVVLLPTNVSYLNADDDVVGVFAINILNGYHALSFGNTGTLAPYLLAPFFAVFGASMQTMFLLPFTLTALLIIVLYGLGRDCFGRWGGVTAAAWMAFPSATALYWTYKLQPGYLEAITFALLALWGTIRIFYRQEGHHTDGQSSPRSSKRHPTLMTFLMGVVALASTLALWANVVVLSIMLACGVIALLNWRRLRTLPLAGYGLFALLWGGMLFPLLAYIHFFSGRDSHQWGGRLPITRMNELIETNAFGKLGALFVGVTRPMRMMTIEGIWMHLIVWMSVVAIAIFLYRTLRERLQCGLVIVVIATATIVLTLVSPFFLPYDVRYILPLYAVLALAYGALVSWAARLPMHLSPRLAAKLPLRLLGVGGASICLALMLAGNGVSVLRGILYKPTFRPEAAIAQELQAHGVRYVHTSYWIGMGVTVESGGEIIPSTAVGPQRITYDHRLNERVAAAEGKATAFAFIHDHHGLGAIIDFEDYLAEHDITCEKVDVCEGHCYRLYHHCTPFPDIQDLVRYLPDELGNRQQRLRRRPQEQLQEPLQEPSPELSQQQLRRQLQRIIDHGDYAHTP